jgi:hypothetical protein
LLYYVRFCTTDLPITSLYFNIYYFSYRLRLLEYWGHGFESHARHGYLCECILFVSP